MSENMCVGSSLFANGQKDRPEGNIAAAVLIRALKDLDTNGKKFAGYNPAGKKDSVDRFFTEGGYFFWCELGGFDPDMVKDMALSVWKGANGNASKGDKKKGIK